MKKFIITPNNYLSKEINAFYHCDYIYMGALGNPDFINVVKNDDGGSRTVYRGVDMSLVDGCRKLKEVLLQDLPLIQQEIQKQNITVCAIPRSKRECLYKSNQLQFKETIKEVAQFLDMQDGTNYITRVKDTRTTHKRGYDSTGKLPYVGITKDTCMLSENIKGKDILLIDDIYTKTINIDEDCIQALLNAGANSVTFYAVGKTTKKF